MRLMMRAFVPRMPSTASCWLIAFFFGIWAFNAIAAQTDADIAASTEAVDGERLERSYDVASGGRWSVHRERLVFAESGGGSLADIDLVERGHGAALHAAVDPYDDSIWVGTDARLVLHFTTDGALVGGATLAGRVDAIAVALDGTCWTIGEGALVHLSVSASVLETLATPLTHDGGAQSLAIDSLRDQLWLANARGVWRIPLDRMREATLVDVEGAHSISVDPHTGDLWLLRDGELVRVDRHGTRQRAFELSADLRLEPAVLDYDVIDQAIVIRTKGIALSFPREAGIEKATPNVGGSMVMAPPFAIAPTVTLVRPPSGAATMETKPDLTLDIGARCNGERCIPPHDYMEHIELDAMIDGGPVSPGLVRKRCRRDHARRATRGRRASDRSARYGSVCAQSVA